MAMTGADDRHDPAEAVALSIAGRCRSSPFSARISFDLGRAFDSQPLPMLVLALAGERPRPFDAAAEGAGRG